MTSDSRVTRRGFLTCLAIGSVSITGLVRVVIDASVWPSESQARLLGTNLVRAAFRDPSSAVRLGAAYMRAVPQVERNLVYLVNVLTAENPVLVSNSTKSEASNMRAILQRQIEKDFASGEVVNIGGWVVARTEARLSALANFIELPPVPNFASVPRPDSRFAA